MRNAAAHVREAYLAYSRTALAAPVSGYVAKRSVQLGQRVAPGAPLMAVVPLDEVWVDANFKEGQLQHMRVGQPVTLTADLYGDKLEYHGQGRGLRRRHGRSVRAAAGAERERQLDQDRAARPGARSRSTRSDVAAHPLQVGLSMQVKVDTQDQAGERLPRFAQSRAGGTRQPATQRSTPRPKIA